MNHQKPRFKYANKGVNGRAFSTLRIAKLYTSEVEGCQWEIAVLREDNSSASVTVELNQEQAVHIANLLLGHPHTVNSDIYPF